MGENKFHKNWFSLNDCLFDSIILNKYPLIEKDDICYWITKNQNFMIYTVQNILDNIELDKINDDIIDIFKLLSGGSTIKIDIKNVH